MNQGPVKIQVFRWAGQWGPFKVKIPCGECALTGSIIEDTLKKECAGIPVDVDTKDWLSHWWQPLFKGGWHAPIVMVEGKVISQGLALNRGLFTQAVVEAHARRTELSGTHVFGKLGCGFCKKAKEALADADRDFVWHDVVAEPGALYEMIARVKPEIGPKTPVTLPQIWVEGNYVGGTDPLLDLLGET